MNYSIPKPGLSIIAVGLYGLLFLGLVGLGTAAYISFNITGIWWQALAFSIIIEACGILEALALVKGKWIAIFALAVALVVSGSYNYTQMSLAAQNLPHKLSEFQLWALAIGPLVSVSFAALTLGMFIKEHDRAVATWEKDKQAWQDKRRLEDDAAKIETIRATAEAKQKAEEAERQERKQAAQRKAQFDYQMEKLRIESETKVQIAQARIEAKERARNLRPDETKVSRNFSLDWRKVPDEDKRLIAGMSTNDICNTYQVSPRTAQNWRKWASSNGSANH